MNFLRVWRFVAGAEQIPQECIRSFSDIDIFVLGPKPQQCQGIEKEAVNRYASPV